MAQTGNTDKLIVAINKHICNLLDSGFVPSTNLLDEQKLAQILRECSYNYSIFDATELENLQSVHSFFANKYYTDTLFTQSTFKVMNIPTEYEYLYIKILKLFSSYGIDILKDCGAVCTSKNKNAIYLFNLFVAGVSATELGNTTAANMIFAQVNQSLKSIN